MTFFTYKDAKEEPILRKFKRKRFGNHELSKEVRYLRKKLINNLIHVTRNVAITLAWKFLITLIVVFTFSPDRWFLNKYRHWVGCSSETSYRKNRKVGNPCSSDGCNKIQIPLKRRLLLPYLMKPTLLRRLTKQITWMILVFLRK